MAEHLRAHSQATTRLLSNLGDEREAVLRAARETQWEYDDEYDDSFDAMAGATADGLADVEGAAHAGGYCWGPGKVLPMGHGRFGSGD